MISRDRPLRLVLSSERKPLPWFFNFALYGGGGLFFLLLYCIIVYPAFLAAWVTPLSLKVMALQVGSLILLISFLVKDFSWPWRIFFLLAAFGLMIQGILLYNF